MRDRVVIESDGVRVTFPRDTVTFKYVYDILRLLASPYLTTAGERFRAVADRVEPLQLEGAEITVETP